MKLVGLVFLGLVASAVLYMPLCLLLGLILDTVAGRPDAFQANEGLGMLLAVFAVMPIAFFLGSIVPGYFSFYDIEHKWSLLWMAPALYLELAGVCISVVGFLLDRFIDVNPPGPHFLRDIFFVILMGLYWYSASAGGVFLGYYLRERFAKWWYRD
jgi:purine-cytosine permease-like protein